MGRTGERVKEKVKIILERGKTWGFADENEGNEGEGKRLERGKRTKRKDCERLPWIARYAS